MRFSYDENASASLKALAVLMIVLVLIVLYFSGILDEALERTISIPQIGDEYEQTVVRRPTDVGIKVPMNVKLTFYQKAGSQRSDIDVDIKHQHEAKGSDDNYVPDPEVISAIDYNTEVGNVGDTNTKFAVDGNQFTSANNPINTNLVSDTGISVGFTQYNYKVWTKSNVYVPPTSDPQSNGHVIFIQATFTHHQKATQIVLSSDIVTFAIHYKMPDYDRGESYSVTYKYYVYVPFNDYAVIEDIDWNVKAYKQTCVIYWREVKRTAREFWGLELFGIKIVGIVRQVDTTSTVAIQYDWSGPRALPINNGDTYGSHSYLYKIR